MYVDEEEISPVITFPVASSITFAAKLLIRFIERGHTDFLTKYLAVREARYLRSHFWWWQDNWWYYNRVVKHINRWNGEFIK